MRAIRRGIGSWAAAVVTAAGVAGCGAPGAGTTPKGGAAAPKPAPAPVAEAAAPSGRTEVATLAGGCFWGMEELIRKQRGVLQTEVGYTGGSVPDATYRVVKTGGSGHAEAVRITFDPAVLSYADLLRFFFRIHDPTTKDRQGNDRGTQYRSAIFFHSPEQQAAAATVIAEETAGTRWTAPIVTQVVAAGPWWTAEDYHQDYLQKNPTGYTCHWVRD